MRKNLKRLTFASLLISSSALAGCKGMKIKFTDSEKNSSESSQSVSSEEKTSSADNLSYQNTSSYSATSNTSSEISSEKISSSSSSSSSESEEDERKTYYIDYNLDGGTNSSSNPVSFKEGDEITLSPASKEGYDFKGWYTSSDELIEVIDYGMNYNLYAKFELHKYKITYHNADGLTNTSPLEFTLEDKVINLSGLEKEYYEFLGWSLSSDSEEYISSFEISEYKNIDFYANFKARTYSITYEGADGLTNENPLSYTYEDEITLLPVEKENTNFVGWFDENGQLVTKIKNQGGNLTLSARFSSTVASYKVEYWLEDLDGVYSRIDEDTKTLQGTIGQEAPYELNSYIGYKALDVTPVTINEDGSTILIINYQRIVSQLTIAYGSGVKKISESRDAKYGETIELDAELNEGYDFVSWTDGENVISETASFSYTMGDKDVTLRCNTKAHVYSVSYNVFGGNNPNTITEYTIESEDIILSDASKQGYDFEGWYADTSYSEKITQISKGSLGDKTLYAKFVSSGNTKYTINHYTEGKDGSYTLYKSEEETGTTDSKTNAVSLSINGYTSKAYQQETITADGSAVVDIYYERVSVTYTLKLNNGEEDITLTGKYLDDVPSVSLPSKEGYTFASWSETLPETYGYSDETFEAQYNVNQYMITFDTDGGSSIADITLDYGAGIPAISSPTREGYTFTGWDKDIPSTMPSSSFTLKALWSINSYTLSFNVNGGSSIDSVTYKYGESLSLPTPERDGYTFTGWDKEITTMPAANTTLTASWSIDTYTITYKFLNGSETLTGVTNPNTTSATINDTVTLKDASYSNLQFAGWYSDEGCTSAITSLSGLTSSITVYGLFSSKTSLVLVLEDLETTYDGSEKSLTYKLTSGGKEISLPDGCSVSLDYGGTPVDAGTYSVTATFSDSSSSYVLAPASKTTATLKINKMKVEITSATVEASYDSSIRTVDQIIASDLNGVTFKNSSTGDTVEVAYSVTSFTDGNVTYKSGSANVQGSTYLVTISLTSSNYEIEDNTFIFKYKTVYLSSDTSTYYTIEDIIENSGTIMLAGNSTSSSTYVTTSFSSLTSAQKNPYSKKSFTVSGILVIPYSETTRSDWSTPNLGNATGYVYAALVIPQDVSITVTGTMAVDAQIYTSSVPNLRGVVINKGSISLENGSHLYSYGFLKGTGTVYEKSGAEIIDCFRNFDYPGGNTSSTVYSKTLPMNAWSFHNVSCETYVYSGANYYAFFYQVISSSNYTAKACIVGTSSSIFKINSGYIIKKTSNSKDNSVKIDQTNITASTQVKGLRDILEIHGVCVDQSFSINIGVSISTSTSVSACFGYLDIDICSGASLTLSNSDYIFLPGCEMKVEEGATLTTNSNVDLVFESLSNINNETLIAGSCDFYSNCIDKVDAKLINNGTFICKGNLGGFIDSSSAGATMDLSSATITASYYSIYHARGTTDSTGPVAYQMSEIYAKGYINGTSDITAFAKAAYTSKESSGSYYWSGTAGTSPSSIDGTINTSAISTKSLCFKGNTNILMSDGTEKEAKDIVVGDEVVTYNETSGEYENKNVTYVWNHGDDYYKIVKTMFSDGSVFEIVGGHEAFDVTLGEYVSIEEDTVENYIGDEFLSYNNGIVTLENYEVTSEYSDCYSFITDGNLSAVTNGVVTRTPEPFEGYYSYLKLVASNSDEFRELVDKYGTYEYDEFKDYISETFFNTFCLKYATILVGSGIITYDDLIAAMITCS